VPASCSPSSRRRSGQRRSSVGRVAAAADRVRAAVEAELSVAVEEAVAFGAADAVPDWTAPVEPFGRVAAADLDDPGGAVGGVVAAGDAARAAEEAEPTPSTDAAAVGEAFTPPTWTTPADESAEFAAARDAGRAAERGGSAEVVVLHLRGRGRLERADLDCADRARRGRAAAGLRDAKRVRRLGTPLFGTPARAPTENVVPSTSMLSCGSRCERDDLSVRAPASSRTSSPSCRSRARRSR
jgi:hypothetical protein